MNFLRNIKGFDFSNSILEDTDTPNELELMIKKLNDEVGGKNDEPVIDSILDDIDYKVIDEKQKPENRNLLSLFIDPAKIDFFKKYKDLKKEKINSISNDLLKSTGNMYSEDQKKRDEANKVFVKQANSLNLELDRANKLIQIYDSMSDVKGEDETVNKKAEDIADTKKSIQKAINQYRKASEKLIEALGKKAEEKGDSDIIIDQVEDSMNKSGLSIININIGGKEIPVEQKMKEIKEKEEKKKPIETFNQREFIKKTISRLRDSNIPDYLDGKITRKGGFFENIQYIKSEYEQLLMDTITRKAINFGENNQQLESENPDVRYQLAYLEATRAFLDKMIETYIADQKSKKQLSNIVGNLYLEKAAYIKNKNLSRKINMSDFAGLKIKREVKVPLYRTVSIPITDEDIIANSKFSKFKSALSSLSGIFGGIAKVDQAAAQRSKNQNRAILQLIGNVSKSVAGMVGGEKAKKSTTRAFKRAGDALNLEMKESVSEDMLMSMDGPNQPGLMFDVPQSVPGGMDTFSKLGPGKKPKSSKKKKKKKTKKKLNGILSFDDFINK
jgi:hypothetical protein